MSLVHFMRGNAMMRRYGPWLFVLLWSTGFIGAELGMRDAPAFTFLAIRFACVVVLLWCWLALSGTRHQPCWQSRLIAMNSGILIHAVHLGGTFKAIELGMLPGPASLVIGLHPLLSLLLALCFLREHIQISHYLGLGLGFGGAFLAIFAMHDLSDWNNDGVALVPMMLVSASMIAIAVGTAFQRRYGRSGSIIADQFWQYIGAVIVVFLAAIMVEDPTSLRWTGNLVFVLIWLVVVLSIVSIWLLMVMIRRLGAFQVAGVFYLVPPLVAIEAWILFDHRLDWLAVAGFALASAGVWLVTRQTADSRTRS